MDLTMSLVFLFDPTFRFSDIEDTTVSTDESNKEEVGAFSKGVSNEMVGHGFLHFCVAWM